MAHSLRVDVTHARTRLGLERTAAAPSALQAATTGQEGKKKKRKRSERLIRTNTERELRREFDALDF